MNEIENLPVIYTVGHSTHAIEYFIGLLRLAGVTALADVRSVPFSKFTPQFNGPALKTTLNSERIAYKFLGEHLGARPKNRLCYRDGVADYALIAAQPEFSAALETILSASRKHQVVLMCAEKDPLDCHRNILVARHLRARGAMIKHILSDGRIEDASDADRRLLRMTRLETADLFSAPSTDPIDSAHDIRGKAIAYSESDGENGTSEVSQERAAI